jgi:hypothetical protein
LKRRTAEIGRSTEWHYAVARSPAERERLILLVFTIRMADGGTDLDRIDRPDGCFNLKALDRCLGREDRCPASTIGKIEVAARSLDIYPLLTLPYTTRSLIGR